MGNLNVAGTTTIIDTVINNTSFTSFSVSGPTIHYSNVTCMSSLNIAGNINGNGTALSNLNYNAITNKPDLSGYATNTNLNNISTFSALNISNLTIISNNKQDTYTPERQYPPSAFNSATGQTETTTEIFNCIPANVYKQSITINNNGTYTLYSSTTLATTPTMWLKDLLFNYNTNDVGGHWIYTTPNIYTPNEGYYAITDGSYIKDSSYKGEWIVINFLQK